MGIAEKILKVKGRGKGRDRTECCNVRGVHFDVKVKKSKPDIAVRNRNYHTATGNHMPYEITQCYLPPGTGDFPAFTPAKAGTRFSDPGGMQG